MKIKTHLFQGGIRCHFSLFYDIATFYGGGVEVEVFRSTGRSFSYEGGFYNWWSTPNGFDANRITNHIVSGRFDDNGNSVGSFNFPLFRATQPAWIPRELNSPSNSDDIIDFMAMPTLIIVREVKFGYLMAQISLIKVLWTTLGYGVIVR
jgi:hypothetical protein